MALRRIESWRYRHALGKTRGQALRQECEKSPKRHAQGRYYYNRRNQHGRQFSTRACQRHDADWPKRSRPFGGVQVIVTGDFCQLPPVKPFQHCLYCGVKFDEDYCEYSSDDEDSDDEDSEPYIAACENEKCLNVKYRESDKWAFRSTVWAECNFTYVNLTTVHRQNDPEFISMLHNCRIGLPFSPREVDLLMHHESYTQYAIKLFPRRDAVDKLNKEKLGLLPGPSRYYIFTDYFPPKASSLASSPTTTPNSPKKHPQALPAAS